MLGPGGGQLVARLVTSGGHCHYCRARGTPLSCQLPQVSPGLAEPRGCLPQPVGVSVSCCPLLLHPLESRLAVDDHAQIDITRTLPTQHETRFTSTQFVLSAAPVWTGLTGLTPL